MRRRSPVEPDDTRKRLRRFVAEEWGGDELAPERWYAARDAWRAEHPDDDLLSAVRGPSVPWRPELI